MVMMTMAMKNAPIAELDADNNGGMLDPKPQTRHPLDLEAHATDARLHTRSPKPSAPILAVHNPRNHA